MTRQSRQKGIFMKLSAQLIIYHLRQHFSAAASSWLSSEPHLEYPVIYQSPGPLAGGKIYISDDPDFWFPPITCLKPW